MKKSTKKSISMLLALAMTLSSAAVVFAENELVTSVKYEDGVLKIAGQTARPERAVDIFLLNPGKTETDLGAATNKAKFNETVNYTDVIYSDKKSSLFETEFQINNLNKEDKYLLYVKTENDEEYTKEIYFNNIYVEKDGADNGDGSKENPFNTINKAKEATLTADEKALGTNVIIGAGEYNEALFMNSDYSGTPENPITYKAAEGAKVVLNGATKIAMQYVSPLTDSAILNRLPESVKKKVVEIDLKAAGIEEEVYNYATDWTEGKRLIPMGVYLNDDYQEISRWPNTGFKEITSTEGGEFTSSNEGSKPTIVNGTVTSYPKIKIDGLDAAKLSSWQDKDNAFIDGYLAVHWYAQSTKLGNTISGNEITVKNTVKYGIGSQGENPNARVVIKNVLEEIDSPGEWYVDEANGKMYYYPPHTLTSEDTLEIATLDSGENGSLGNMIYLINAKHITVEGITIEKNSYGDNNSNDWYHNNGIKIYGGNDITIKNCTIKDVAEWGIRSEYTDNATIDGCVINNTGKGGIYVRSGNQTELTSENDVIKNCHISDINRNYTDNVEAGVYVVGGVGVVIKNNTFNNIKNSAIRYDGTKHLFLENEILNVVNEASDAGAIYSVASHINYGNVIKNNYVYHIGGVKGTYHTDSPVAGIFWDDNNSGGTAIGNVFVSNAATAGAAGVTMAGGTDNTVTDNIIVNASGEQKTAVSVSDRDYVNNDGTLKDTFLSFRAFLTFLDATTDEFKATIDTNGDGTKSDAEREAAVLRITDSDWLDAYKTNFDGRIVTAYNHLVKKENWKPNVVKNNFAYNSVDYIAEPQTKVFNPTEGDIKAEYVATESKNDGAFVKENDYDYRLKDAQGTAAITEETPLTAFGAQGYEIAAEEKEFDLVFPANKAAINSTKTYLKWEKVNVADEYRYVVSKNEDLSDPVIDETTVDTLVEIENLDEDTKYYWGVTAKNLSFNIGGDLATKKGEFTTADYEFVSAQYNEEAQTITVDFVNNSTEFEDVNFIAAVKVGGKLMSSAVDTQNVIVTEGDTITIPVSTLTSLDAEGATLELYIWNKDMTALTGKMPINIK